MLRLDGLTKTFGGDAEVVRAVDALTLEVQPGELVSLLGPSGCGKTTTLRLIAGFETPTDGTITIDGRDITRVPPQDRGTGMVFQSYALFPHLDVFENVAFGLRTRGVPRAAIAERVRRALDLVGLDGYARRSVQALSGGQQQRVALARALAPEPPLLLLDEPLSNLDASLREKTRVELRALLKRLGMTAVFVTHDQEEAFAVADRIALLDHGRLQQYGSPRELYEEPATAFVASFIGHANFFDGILVSADGAGGVRIADGCVWPTRANGGNDGDRVRVTARPEALEFVPPGPDVLKGRVIDRRFAGAYTAMRVQYAAGSLVVHVPAAQQGIGDEVGIRPRAPVRTFPPET